MNAIKNTPAGNRLATVRLVYFSGTGCTAYAAETIQKQLESRGHAVQMQELRHGVPAPDGDFTFLIVCFVVHACTAPHPVLRWARETAAVKGIPAAVISVSAGGEVTPNLGCRLSVKHLLAKKGYSTEYEKMLVMPSNWMVSTKPALAAKLLEVLPHKTAFLLDELETGSRRKTGVGPGNRLLSLTGKMETAGARSFGRHIKVDPSCTGCARCARLCPVGNISMTGGKPSFGGECVLCLSCIYQCPEKALVPGHMKFVAIPDGFDLKKIIASLPWTEPVDIAAETSGFSWLGLRRYLLDDSDIK